MQITIVNSSGTRVAVFNAGTSGTDATFETIIEQDDIIKFKLTAATATGNIVRIGTKARRTIDCNDTQLILLTLIGDLINTYKKSQIIEDLGNLFNDKNTLEKPDKIEKFITSENILNITRIRDAIRNRTCTNRVILYCIQMLCKKTYTIC